MNRCSLSACLVLSASALQLACSGTPAEPHAVPGSGGSSAAGAAAVEASAGSTASGGAPVSTSAGAGGALAGASAGAAGALASGGSAGVNAGSAGASAIGGAAGSAGAGGGSTTGPTGASAGCGKEFADPFNTAVEHDMQVTVAAAYTAKYASRKYYTQLPKGYDGKTPIPMVFYGQGCGQSGPESSGFSDVQNADNFLLVQAIPVGGCFEAGKEGHADSPDGPYFDQALAEIEAKYCIDKSKVYVAGWSSGAWLSTYLACTRGGVVRAAATVAGGLQHDHGTCVGGAAAIMYIGTGDGENPVVDMVNGFDVGTGQSRDIFVKTNGCSTTSAAWDPAYATCQIYGSCDSPVVWCPVPGGHGAGNDKLPAAAWKFWGSLE
jgi:hypothetical protein